MSRQTIEFVDGPVYPPAALDHRRIQRGTSTGTGSSSYDQRNRLASFHQRSTLSDRSSVATDFNYPPNHNRAGSVGSRYTRTVRPGRCSIMMYLHFSKHGLWWPVVTYQDPEAEDTELTSPCSCSLTVEIALVARRGANDRVEAFRCCLRMGVRRSLRLG